MDSKKNFKIVVFSFVLLISIVSFIETSSAYSWNFNSQSRFFDCIQNNFCLSLDHTNMQMNKDYLALGSGSTSKVFYYLWVANTDENTISKIDTRTNKEVGRYYTCDSSTYGSCLPSRTAIDTEGDVWVGNRVGSMDVVKIAGVVDTINCKDTNLNGIIDTSRDINGNGQIDIYEMFSWGQDECVMNVVNYWGNKNTITYGPRGLTIDADGFLWVGIYDPPTYYKIDPNGNLMSSLTTGGGSYGMVAGKNNVVWSDEPSQPGPIRGGLVKINTIDNSYTRYNQDLFGCRDRSINCFYVIASDSQGNVFLTNWQRGILQKFDPTTNSITDFPASSGAGSKQTLRGLTVDKNGYAWTTTWTTGYISKIDGNTGQEVCYLSGIILLSGISIDDVGNVWAIGSGFNNQVYKIDPSNCNLMTSVRVGLGPYSYSDTTGNVATRFVKDGFWEVSVGSQTGGIIDWKDIRWKENNIQSGDSIEVILTFLDANNNIIPQNNNYDYLHNTPTNIERDYYFNLTGIFASKLRIKVIMHKELTSPSLQLSNLEITTNQITSNLGCHDIPQADCTPAATLNNPDALSYFPECIDNATCNSCYCQWDSTTAACKPTRELINSGSSSCSGVVDCVTNPTDPACLQCTTQCIIDAIENIDNCADLRTITQTVTRHLVANRPECLTASRIAGCSNYQKTFNCSPLDFFNFRSFMITLVVVLLIYFFMSEMKTKFSHFGSQENHLDFLCRKFTK